VNRLLPLLLLTGLAGCSVAPPAEAPLIPLYHTSFGGQGRFTVNTRTGSSELVSRDGRRLAYDPPAAFAPDRPGRYAGALWDGAQFYFVVYDTQNGASFVRGLGTGRWEKLP